MIFDTGYVHGGDIYSRPIRLDFSANVNPFGAPEPVKAAVRAAAEDPSAYPDPCCGSLREKLAAANGALIDALVEMTKQAAEKPNQTLFDAGATLRNAESLSKAIQLAAMTQRDLYRLPSMDQELRKKAEAARKKEANEKLKLEREKWEAEQREKAKAAEAVSGTVWEVIEPDGEDTDG